MSNNELIKNIDKLHTTSLGINRIKNNLNLNDIDVINYIKKVILDKETIIYRQGKNWYSKNSNIIITINASSYTVITAHKKKKRG